MKLCRDCRHFTAWPLSTDGGCSYQLADVIGMGVAPNVPQPSHSMRYSGPCGYEGKFHETGRDEASGAA